MHLRESLGVFALGWECSSTYVSRVPHVSSQGAGYVGFKSEVTKAESPAEGARHG
jgi:hypothetical protein